jgi:hypothetical protein
VATDVHPGILEQWVSLRLLICYTVPLS